MTPFQKLVGRIFRRYKFKILRREETLLVDSLINSLTDEYQILKEQRRETGELGIGDSDFYPGFKPLSVGYTDAALRNFRKRGTNYKLSGLRIFSRKLDRYANVEFLIHDNLLSALRIDGISYELEEFDLKRIQIGNLERTHVEFPPGKADLFYERLDMNLKTKLTPEDIFDIDLGNRTYFVFYDLEDGNYLAADSKLNVYSLVHEARPMAKKLKCSLAEILEDIQTGKFDKDRHVDERFRNTRDR